jgi:hypothetical protein
MGGDEASIENARITVHLRNGPAIELHGADADHAMTALLGAIGCDNIAVPESENKPRDVPARPERTPVMVRLSDVDPHAPVSAEEHARDSESAYRRGVVHGMSMGMESRQ